MLRAAPHWTETWLVIKSINSLVGRPPPTRKIALHKISLLIESNLQLLYDRQIRGKWPAPVEVRKGISNVSWSKDPLNIEAASHCLMKMLENKTRHTSTCDICMLPRSCPDKETFQKLIEPLFQNLSYFCDHCVVIAYSLSKDIYNVYPQAG